MSEKMSAEELVALSHFVRFELDFDDRAYPVAKKLLAHIAALQREADGLREALKPFAGAVTLSTMDDDDLRVELRHPDPVRVGWVTVGAARRRDRRLPTQGTRGMTLPPKAPAAETKETR